MSAFYMELPNDVIKDIEFLSKNSRNIFEEMTKAGAEVALSKVKSNMSPELKSSAFASCLGLTKPYITPSDGGINTKVIISGYFKNHNGVITPAPLVANVFEYGSIKFKKRPFFRKSFTASEIKRVMLKKQKELSGGVLDE